MKKINLSLLMEQATTNIVYGYPDLMTVVKKYRELSKSNSIILDSDFNSLLEYTIQNQPFIDMIKHNDTVNYTESYDTPMHRVFNFYNTLKKEVDKQIKTNSTKVNNSNNYKLSLTPQELIKFENALDNLLHIVDYGFLKVHHGQIVKVTNIPSSNPKIPIDEPNPQVQPKIRYSFKNTAYLKSLSFFNNGSSDIDVTDYDYSSFSNLNDPNKKLAFDAIMANDKNLRLNTDTSEGKVYNLWVSLKKGCQDKMVRYINLLKLSGVNPNSRNATHNQTSSRELSTTPKANLKGLPDKSEVELAYSIYSQNLKKVIFSNIKGIFNIYHLRRNFEFINKADKNNWFIFNTPIPMDIEIGRTYPVKYYSATDELGEDYVMYITDIKTATVDNFNQFGVCNAADELKKLLYNIRNVQ